MSLSSKNIDALVFSKYRQPLTFRWGTCLDNLCFFSVPRRWWSWRAHLEQWTYYRQRNLSVYPLNSAFSKWPSSQMHFPPMQ